MSEIQGVRGFRYSNWANTFSCEPELYFEPTNVDEIRQIIFKARKEKKKVKVIGVGHSPSDIPCTQDYMINLLHMSKIISVDKETMQIKAEAGLTLHDLHQEAQKHGLAVSIIPSVSNITLGGLLATGTHGTGGKHGILATYVTEMTLITAQGEIIKCSVSSNKDIFDAARCHLGALGIIVDVKWQCEMAFKLCSETEAVTFDELMTHIDSKVDECEHFKCHWWPHTENVCCHRVNRSSEPIKESVSWFWNHLIGFHLLQFLYWLSTFFPWFIKYINKYHFILLKSKPEKIINEAEKIFTMNCLFPQYTTEWAIPREKTVYALKQMKKWLETSGFYAHMPVEVRFVAKDNIYLSPAFGHDVCFIGIIMYRPYGKSVEIEDFWNFYEDLMFSVGGRPHWAKAHKLDLNALQKLYPNLDDFLNVCIKLDPDRLFVNKYLERTLFPLESQNHNYLQNHAK